MGSIQRQLSEYLQYELYHLLGAYGIAGERLGRLARQIEEEVPDPRDLTDPAGDEEEPGDAAESNQLAYLARLASRYNRQASWRRHGPPREHRAKDARAGAPARLMRDPIPRELPLTWVERFEVGAEGSHGKDIQDLRQSIWRTPNSWRAIPKFYSEAIYALQQYDHSWRADRAASGEDAQRMEEDWRQIFARSLIAMRDGALGKMSTEEVNRRRLRHLDRCQDRLRRAHRLLSLADSRTPVYDSRQEERQRDPDDFGAGDDRQGALYLNEEYPPDADFLTRIATDDLSAGASSLPMFVISVQAEAHLSMHAVEAWQSMSLGERAAALGSEEKRWLDQELERCIVLDTFAYCVSRTAPWIFMADAQERRMAFAEFSVSWENVVPARGVWIAAQVSLLALHRRAYARAIRGEPDQSYNDYHKLQRLIRDVERRVRAAPIQVDGALDFLAALDGQAHHHIGELYRSEQAHGPARKHFNRASFRLEQLRTAGATDEVLTNSRRLVRLEQLRTEGAMDEVLTNSRRLVGLQVSHGKTSYELGRHKEALCWHLRGWKAFLELQAADTKTVTNTEKVEAAIRWLERVLYEPELHKAEVASKLEPVVEQLRRVTVSRRYGVLAGEILLRLGHLLFVLNLDGDERPGGESAQHQLASTCLCKAVECDNNSTLIYGDLFKTRPRNGEPLKPEELHISAFSPIAEQWPRGGNDYERIARAAEYLLLRTEQTWTTPAGKEQAHVDANIARELLLNFFKHTDSINVRKSQVHHLLMREQSQSKPPGGDGSAAIEFVCMRRYSSAYPLLPRPSAFRALGGGYFVRLHSPAKDPSSELEPFGVVVDPGTDFVENLYRTSYSLSDINMIVVSHDHVDHAGSLDSLISLLHVRSQLLEQQDEEGKVKPVTILLCKSMARRYKRADRLKESGLFKFECIEKLAAKSPEPPRVLEGMEYFPKKFEIIAMSTREIDEEGHRDLSKRPSHGLCLRVKKEGPSLAITGDTPVPPRSEEHEAHTRWRQEWKPALEADILVAHLSSVPLTELRQMAGVGVSAELEEDAGKLEEIRDQLQNANRGLAGQIEYGLWLRSHQPAQKEGGSPATPIPPAPLVGPVGADWQPPVQHSFLRGILRWARGYRDARGERPGLLVIGELSEELGTMRGNVAKRLNEKVFEAHGTPSEELESTAGANRDFYALSGDIGLRAFVTVGERVGGRGAPRIEVLCTTCNLDTDRVASERYHLAHDMEETCVKGENEGIFYNCGEHAPTRQNDPTFLEQLERFDIFGR
jgi:hypothetical protein